MDRRTRIHEIRRTLQFPVLGCVLFAGIFFRLFLAPRNYAVYRMPCLSQVKQIALAQLMYGADYDERLPRAERWMDDLFPYTKTESVFHCPGFLTDSGPVTTSDPYGYAMNGRVAAKKTSDVGDESKTYLAFDSNQTQRNASAMLPDLPNPGRHGDTDSVGFVDGHAKSIRIPVR